MSKLGSSRPSGRGACHDTEPLVQEVFGAAGMSVGGLDKPVFSLTALSKKLGRPKYSLEVLSRDPFGAGDEPARVRDAEWITELWRRFCIKPGAHLRRTHYVLISQDPGSILMPNGKPYENKDKPFILLNASSLDARYLHMIPAADLVDRRNNPPIIYLPNDASNAEVKVDAGPGIDLRKLRHVPKLALTLPKILQRYHLEIWCEKTSMNDILLPICERYGINLITGAGEQSLTSCVQVVQRALANGGRPVRVLYISDFDPGGKSMPVAVARKVEFEIRDGGHDLDLQVRPILLDEAQVLHYGLPPIPMKDDEHRGPKFMERFGVTGATELDALEALHPGEFERIVTQEIMRYYDGTLDTRVNAAVEEAQAELDGINAEVRQQHAIVIKRLKAAQKKLAAAVRAYQKLARPILGEIKHDLKAAMPNFEWPEPEEGDEDEDPMFDSTRDFIEQTDRYKKHQRKEISRTRKLMKREEAICIICSKPYEKTKRNIFGTCTRQFCRAERARRSKAEAEGRPIQPRTPDDVRKRHKSIQQKPAVCIVCKETFMMSAINKTGTCTRQSCKNEARARREALANGVVREDRWPRPVTSDSGKDAVDL
jgi:hypothetical protein